MNYYITPYQTIKSIKPLLAWPKDVPFNGKPKAVADIPKLCFYVTPGAAIKKKDVKKIR